MKILYVTTISNTVNAFLIPHIKFLLELGNDVDIACNIKSAINKEIIECGCRVHNVEFQRHPFNKANYSAYKNIRRLVLSEGYGLIHVHTPTASFLTRFACRNIPNLKVLYTAHGFHFFKGAPLKNWIFYYTMEKLAARWTDGIITMNKEDYDSAKKMKLRKDDSVYYIHGVGIDVNKYSPQNLEIKNKLREEYVYSKGDFILFYAAELNFNKHQDLLIDVVNVLNNKMLNIKLLLAGNGNSSEIYKKRVIDLNLDKNIIFLGHRNDVSRLLRVADIIVSSSRREGLPVSVMEAMVTGLPLIVTDCRGNRDLVINDENGYVVGVNDVIGFSSAIEQLYYSEELRQSFGEKSRANVKEYALENVILEMKEIYSNYLV